MIDSTDKYVVLHTVFLHTVFLHAAILLTTIVIHTVDLRHSPHDVVPTVLPQAVVLQTRAVAAFAQNRQVYLIESSSELVNVAGVEHCSLLHTGGWRHDR